MLKIKWTERITNDEVFLKDERREITFKNLKKIDATHRQGIQLGITSL
jgi:hypothetical protein